MYFFLDSRLARSKVLVDYANRPAAGAGTNWLITGSDSRAGLTRAQKRHLHTGSDAGHRSDTILILHIPSNGGRAVLISLPRDSYVNIPGFGQNKINAAYAFGGPRLLAKTVQNNTGLRIEHYIGIGFGGLVNAVDAVGGVRMCLPAPIHDQASGLNLKAACQTLDGAAAPRVRAPPAAARQPGPPARAESAGLPASPAPQDDQPGHPAQPVRLRPGRARRRRGGQGGLRHPPVPAAPARARPA